MAPNKIIQSLWVGDRLSTMERLCLCSFLKNGHDFHLYVYNDVVGIPSGVTVMDANTIIPNDRIFLDDRNGIASFSDWFRYKLLYEKGGWWVDMDVICVKPFDFKDDYCFAREDVDNPIYSVNNGIIKAPAEAEFLSDLLNYIDSCDKDMVIRGAFGPSLLERVLSGYESGDYIQSPEVFCPIHWQDTEKFIEPSDLIFPDATFAIHLWNEMWRLNNLDKDAQYHPNSIYEILKRKY